MKRSDGRAREITVFSYAKINLSLDVGAVREDGFHPVDMVMQQLLFHDDVRVRFREEPIDGEASQRIVLTSNRSYLPRDSRNLAWKAAELMAEVAGAQAPSGTISIHLEKRIPVAAGLAGGSGNGAAVMHALNELWDLDLGLEELLELGKKLGSDVPFCLMGQAKRNPELPAKVRRSARASCAARAVGTGTELTPIHSRRMPILLAKPHIGVSTAEVYKGIDQTPVFQHPNNEELINCLENSTKMLYYNCINVLENFTLAHYPAAAELKERMQALGGEWTLMSGSGPSVFTIYRTMEEARAAAMVLREDGYEAYWTRTMD